MINFQYTRATDVADAVRQIAIDPSAKLIAGGTNLIDLMKKYVERPSRLIDISRLLLQTVEETAAGGVRIGALVPNSDLAYHPLVGQRYPVLASAILADASQQLRNMASTGAISCSGRDPDAAEFADVRAGSKTKTAEKPVAFGLLAGGDRHRPRHGDRHQPDHYLGRAGHRHADVDERAGLENQPQSKIRSVLNLSEISSGPCGTICHANNIIIAVRLRSHRPWSASSR